MAWGSNLNPWMVHHHPQSFPNHPHHHSPIVGVNSSNITHRQQEREMTTETAFVSCTCSDE
jgi:hypothetical protein